MPYNQWMSPSAMQNQYNPYMGTQSFSAPQNGAFQRHEIVRVNGRNGAEAYQMPPNSQILMLDETAPVVWLKVTDGAGYPTLTPYNISPMQTQEQKDNDRFTALESRISALEGVLNESNHSNPVRGKQSTGKSGAD